MSASLRIGRRVGILIAVLAGNLFGIAATHAQNVAPVISGSPPASVVTGHLYDFRPTATDGNGDTLVFGVSRLPRWLNFDKQTGRLYGTPASSDVGTTRRISVAVSDGKASVSLPRFTISVVANSAPSISGTPSAAAKETEFYAFLPKASDPEGDPLLFSITGKPSWATFTPSSGLLSGIPPAGSAGTYSNIAIWVSDGQSVHGLPAFNITVSVATNRPPTISGTPATSTQTGQLYSFKPTAADPDGQTLRFSILGLPTWATFNTTTGVLSGTPASTQAGTYSNLIISVNDGSLSASLAPFTIAVAKANTAPSISGVPSGAATTGKAYSFTPSAADPDGQTLKFAITNKPAWAVFDTASGRLYGTPTSANLGTFSSIVISVTDGLATSALSGFSIVVANPAPAGTATLSWLPPTQNVDGTPLTNLAGYRVVYGQSSANLTSSLDIPNPAITTAMIESLASGTWYFAIKAYTTDSIESSLSSLAQKMVN